VRVDGASAKGSGWGMENTVFWKCDPPWRVEIGFYSRSREGLTRIEGNSIPPERAQEEIAPARNDTPGFGGAFQCPTKRMREMGGIKVNRARGGFRDLRLPTGSQPIEKLTFIESRPHPAPMLSPSPDGWWVTQEGGRSFFQAAAGK
jgi:hypothetical protein